MSNLSDVTSFLDLERKKENRFNIFIKLHAVHVRREFSRTNDLECYASIPIRLVHFTAVVEKSELV